MKNYRKTEVPISFSLLQGNTEMENLEKFNHSQRFLCRKSLRVPALSAKAATATGADAAFRDALQVTHHQSLELGSAPPAKPSAELAATICSICSG